MRIVPTRATRSNAPFATKGASLYAGFGAPDPGPGSIAFRNLRAWPVRGAFTAGTASKIGGANTAKTARLAFAADPTATFSYAIPVAWHGQIVYAQVRTCETHVENENTSAPARLAFDGSGNLIQTIVGTAKLLSQEQRDGGVVRLRFQYFAGNNVAGAVAPLQFRATRTAGPSTPADVLVPFASRTSLYTLDTPALLDSAPYAYTIQAENGATVLVLLTGIAVQADATGPAAPTGATAVPW